MILFYLTENYDFSLERETIEDIVMPHLDFGDSYEEHKNNFPIRSTIVNHDK